MAAAAGANGAPACSPSSAGSRESHMICEVESSLSIAISAAEIMAESLTFLETTASRVCASPGRRHFLHGLLFAHFQECMRHLATEIPAK